MTPPRRRARPRRVLRHAAALSLILAALPGDGSAQATPRAMDGVRVGVTLGGVGVLGLSVEWISEELRSVELTLATFGFQDVSVGLTGRHYFGAGWLRPTVGAGLWLTRALSPGQEGTAVLVRAPFGFDWRATDEQFLGATIAANRVLWMTRESPDVEALPAEGRLVPIPELAWRWRP